MRSRPFEGVDVRAAGAKGGRASGVSRRLRKQRELEAKVIASRNGAAAMKLLELKRRDQAELLDRQLAADRMVAELDMEAENLRTTINDLRGECDTLRDQRAVLDAELKAAAASDASLIAVLRDAGEERTERALREIGWLDESDVDAA